MRILSNFNQKGGVGKTTSTVNIAAGLASLGKKVLVIDFDPQANTSSVLFGVGAIKAEESIFRLIHADMNDIEINIQDFIKTYEKGKIKFDVIPSHLNLAIVELDLISRTGREFFLKRIISKISGYDYILIDCQPSLGVLVTNVLCCSPDNELITHVRADSFSRESIDIVFKSIQSLKKNLGVMPKSYKILVTQFSEKQISDRNNVNQIEKDFPGKMFETAIRKDTKLSQAHDARSDIFNYDSTCNGAVDYMKVAKEIVSQE